MAKDKDSKPADDAASKSKTIVGGTQAHDLPASVGGTKDAAPGTGPRAPGEAPRDTLPSGPPEPGRDDTPATSHGPGAPATGSPPPLSTMPGPGMDAPTPGGFVGTGRRPHPDDTQEDADGATAGDFVGAVRGYIEASKAGAHSEALRYATGALGAFGSVMDSGGFVGRKLTAKTDTIGAELAGVRNNLSTAVTSGRRVHWKGDGTNPTTGSPAPLAVLADNHPQAIDPQALIVVWELVSKLWDMFQNWRHRG